MRFRMSWGLKATVDGGRVTVDSGLRTMDHGPRIAFLVCAGSSYLNGMVTGPTNPRPSVCRPSSVVCRPTEESHESVGLCRAGGVSHLARFVQCPGGGGSPDHAWADADCGGQGRHSHA